MNKTLNYCMGILLVFFCHHWAIAAGEFVSTQQEMEANERKLLSSIQKDNEKKKRGPGVSWGEEIKTRWGNSHQSRGTEPDNEEPYCSEFNLRVKFDPNMHLIKPESYAVLRELAKFIKGSNRYEYDFWLIGHTDSTGNRILNKKLSKDRAVAVRYFLTEVFEIPPSILNTQGKGPDELIRVKGIENKTDSRRVEIQYCL